MAGSIPAECTLFQNRVFCLFFLIFNFFLKNQQALRFLKKKSSVSQFSMENGTFLDLSSRSVCLQKESHRSHKKTILVYAWNAWGPQIYIKEGVCLFSIFKKVVEKQKKLLEKKVGSRTLSWIIMVIQECSLSQKVVEKEL